VATAGVRACEGLVLAQELRRQGLRTGVDLEGRSLKAQLRQANKEQFRYALILGEVELAKGLVTVKDMGSGEQREVPRGELLAVLDGAKGDRPR
jgi:histidyl-tRNA synthetase